MRSRFLCLALVATLTACGNPGPATGMHAASTTSKASASASTPNAAPLLLAVETAVPTPDHPGSISLFTADGRAAGLIQLKPGSGVLVAAGRRIFIRATDGSIDALHRDGSLEVLDATPNTLAGIGGFVANPDGTRWVWGSQTPDTTSQSIYMAGDGTAPRAIATFAYATVLGAYAWTPEGVFLDSYPPDYEGYRPFNDTFGASGGVRRLDVNTGSIAPFPTPNCSFSDVSPDGLIACFPVLPSYLQPTRHMLRIISPSGAANDLTLAIPRFNYIGDAYFSPDGSLLTVAGATGVGDNFPLDTNPSPKPEEYGTDLVQTADASIKKFGPMGTRPAMGTDSWLPDGRLVLWRPDSFGGPPGIFVLDPRGSGQGSEIEVSGNPIGYLTN